MLSICGEIILCDVSSCSEARSYFFYYHFFYRNCGWASFLSYFWLETWGWEVGSVRVVGKFYFIYHFNLISLFKE